MGGFSWDIVEGGQSECVVIVGILWPFLPLGIYYDTYGGTPAQHLDCNFSRLLSLMSDNC